MAEIALPVIVTAIANSELEGFVAGTLFSQGWSVIYRALDAPSLMTFLDNDSDQSKNIVLIYSPDLPGLLPESVAALQKRVRQVVGFSSDAGAANEYVGIFSTPTDASELLNLVRGFVRAPLLRSAIEVKSKKRRARVLALGAPSGSSGCTTVAINLAMELSILGHETLLLDADVRRPSIAPLLALHKLDSDQISRTIAPHFSVSEFSQERVAQLDEYLDHLLENFDFLVIDLGSIEGISDSLTDRRWTSSLVHWSCERADEIWFLGKADTLGIHRLESLVRDFSAITIQAKVSVVLNMKVSGRKGIDREGQFLSVVAPIRPQRIFTLPYDPRTVTKTQEQRAALVEIDDRSTLRKAILNMAVEFAT